jgi:SLT domain-containing protein
LTDKAKIVGGAYMDYTPGGMLLRGGKNLMQGKNFLAPSAKFSPQNQFVQSPKSDKQKLIEENAKRTGLMPEILEAMMHQESRGKSNAVSNKGATGLMQLMPATAARFGVTNSFDPAQNIAGGATYMRWLLNRFKGNTQLALAGYNTGEGNVDKAIKRAGGSHRFEDIKPFLAKETQGYVTSIMADLKNRLANSSRGGSNGLAINDDYEVETGFTYSGGPARRKLRYGNTPVERMSTISQDDYERNSARDPFMRAGSVLDVRVTNPESFVDRYDLETGEAMPFKNRYDVMPKGITDAAQNLSFLNDIPHDLPAVFSTFKTEFKSMAGEFGTFGLGFPPLIDGMQSLDTAVEKTEASLTKAPLTFKELMVATEKVKLSFAQTLRGSLDQASGFLPSQQVGKKRGFFSKLLGGAAPFLQFIPGFGPIASQLASIAGSAIGGDYGGALSGAAGLNLHAKAATFGGKRAFGGPVSKGRAYIVGDGGREEVFMPDQDGMIHPNANNFRRGGASSGGNSAYEHTMLAVLHTLQAHTERVGHHLARIEATSPGDVFVAGAKARPHAATDAVTRSLAMDASRIDVMGRRLNLA